ncbi:cytochrome P460 family protein [Dyella sp. C11]|uniref:cytochrome P460 family protein n=1 Tax=Dyella sp. C11 TaxID=2126991 RepID=UPI000D64BAF1|nr:cytochrome P460 family protein [Dyella sp. C11]
MKHIHVFAVLAVTTLSLGGSILSSASEEGYDNTAVLDGKLPPAYRDWTLITVAHEEGNLNDIRAVLGNDIAVKAYRDGTLPFPDGAVIARVAWAYVPSEENNKAFGHAQSFVAGAPTHIQFMVKNSREYATTGGWGYTQFQQGKPSKLDVAACFSCHLPVKNRDFVFARYSP